MLASGHELYKGDQTVSPAKRKRELENTETARPFKIAMKPNGRMDISFLVAGY